MQPAMVDEQVDFLRQLERDDRADGDFEAADMVREVADALDSERWFQARWASRRLMRVLFRRSDSILESALLGDY
jgi:hypothetical protein